MVPGAASPESTFRNILPDGSYAKAAKSLQTSGLSVSERVQVAEGLLNAACRLTPRPEPLVRQHAIFALCSSRSEFADYLPRYWKLLHELHLRDPVPLPDSLATAAAATFSNASCTNIETCTDALSAFFADEVLRPKLERLAPLIAAVCGCRLEGRTSATATLDASVERLIVSMLIQYDDVQKRDPVAKHVFACAFSSLVRPILRSSGVVRKAGEIVLRHGLLPDVQHILLKETYFTSLYDNLKDCENAPQSDVFPELVELMFRTCKYLARERAQKAFEFPKVGEKRLFAAAVSSKESHLPPSISKDSALPREVSIPLRFLQEMCHSLLWNTMGAADQGDICLATFTRLIATAADLSAYRLSYEQNLGQFKKIRIGNKSLKMVRVNLSTEANVSSMISKQLSFVSERLQEWSSKKGADVVSAAGVDRNNTSEVAALADSAIAIIRLSMDSVENDLPELIEAVVRCAEQLKECNERTTCLSMLIRELFSVYSSTRKVPELMRLVSSSLNEECVLDNFHILLGDPLLQECIVECIWALPRGHAEECVNAFLEVGCLRPRAAVSVCFLLSLIVESVDLSTLKTIIPVVGNVLCKHIASIVDVGAPVLSALRFVQASVASSLAKNSYGASSNLYSDFVGSVDIGKLQASKSAESQVWGYRLCEMRRLAGLTHLLTTDCAGHSEKGPARDTLTSMLCMFADLPFRETVGDMEHGTSIPASCDRWETLLGVKGQNWIEAFLRIVGSACPLFDFLLMENGICVNPKVVTAFKAVLDGAFRSLATMTSFWEQVLETNVGRQLVCDCASSILFSDAHENAKLSVLKCVLMISSNAPGIEKLTEACEFLICDVSSSQKIRLAARRGLTSLMKGKKLCYDEDKLERLTVTPRVDIAGLKGDESSAHIISECCEIVFKGSQSLGFRTKKVPRDLEASVFSGIHKVLAVLQNSARADDILKLHCDQFSKLVVCLSHWSMCCKVSNLGPCLHLLALLARGEDNIAIEGVADHIAKKLRFTITQAREDADSVVIKELQRLIRISTCLALGVSGANCDLDWNIPPSMVLRTVERASRGAKAVGRFESVSKLGVLSVQSVSSILWHTRHADCSTSFVRVEGVCGRTSIFLNGHSREARELSLWKEAEWAIATVNLEAGRTKSLHENDMLQTSLLELLDIASDCRPNTLLSVIQTGIVRASSLQSRRVAQALACLRCVRAALRSVHLDEACARVISRHFEKVSGTMAVSAIADTATALTRVKDSKVRGALEHGAAALLKHMSLKGRSEALLACEDNSRDVLRALMETYRLDFQYNRQ